MATDIEATLAGGVMELVFCSQDGLNTMDDPWFTLLDSSLQQAACDPAVRAVLLSARGAVFCAGANLRGMATSALHRGFTGSPLAGLIERLTTFAKPLVAAVHGNAIGGGVTLLLHCDLVVAAADTQFRLPFTSRGAVPSWHRASCCPARRVRDSRASCSCSAIRSTPSRRSARAS
jgi:enoyl-CoA hydratase/carnithine racemase